MKKRMLAALALGAVACAAYATGFSVPDMELDTIGRYDSGTFGLHTRSYVDMLFDGGYKFGGRLTLNINSGDLEKALSTTADATRYVSVKQLAVTIRDFPATSLDLSYFIGDMTALCSGDDFPAAFGTESIAPTLRGFGYFPTGIGGDTTRFYDGISAVSGTGFALSATPPGGWFKPAFYLYQDGDLGTGVYSADLRGLFNLDPLQMDVFAGASIPAGTTGYYRFGFLFAYRIGTAGEFIAQIGLPRLDFSSGDPLNIDNFYFLFEPRLDLGFTELIITLFRHPAWYRGQATDESGKMDLNFNLRFGGTNPLTWGFESMTSFAIPAGTTTAWNFTERVSPYLGFRTEGVSWNAKLGIYPMNYSVPLSMFEPYLGIKAGF